MSRGRAWSADAPAGETALRTTYDDVYGAADQLQASASPASPLSRRPFEGSDKHRAHGSGLINTEEWGAGDFFVGDGEPGLGLGFSDSGSGLEPLSQAPTEATGMVGAAEPSSVADFDPLRADRTNVGVFWLQLISTGAAMATLSVEDRRYDLAMHILQRLERWATRDDLLSKRQRLVGRAVALDAFAYFFYRRKKLHASLRHTKLGAALHEWLGNHEGVATGLLQTAIVQCFLGKFHDCHKTLYKFLAMIEDGRLAFQTATPRQVRL